MIAVGIPLYEGHGCELKRDYSMTSLGSRQLLKKPHEEQETPAFGAVDGSSHRHRERLLTVPSGWKRIAMATAGGPRASVRRGLADKLPCRHRHARSRPLSGFDDGAQRVAVIRIAGQRPGVQNKG